MADTKIVTLDVKTNADNASKDFDNLSKSIKAVNASATDLDATFEEVYGDLKPLTARMGEAEDRLYELAKAGKQSSQEYKDLLKSVGEYKKIQQQTDLVVDAAAQTISSKLSGSLNAAAGGFSLVQGSMSLFGSESKDVEQAILKVQSAMAISQGVESIKEGAKSVTALGTAIKATSVFQKISAAAQWLWNAAMNANPLGAILLAITAVIAAGYALVKFFMDSAAANETAAAATKRNTEALKNQEKATKGSAEALKENNDKQYALAKASGASSEALRKLALKHAEETVALNHKNTMLARSTFLREADTLAALKANGASDEVIANQDKLVKAAYTSFDKQREGLYASYKDRRKVITDNEVAITQERTDANKKAQEDAKKHQEDLLQKQKEAATKALEEKKKKDAEDAQKVKDHNKAIEDLNKKYDDEKLNREADTAVKKENLDYQRRLNEISNIATTELEKQTLVEKLEGEHKARLAAANLTDAEKRAADQKAIDDKIAADKKVITDKEIEDEKAVAQAKKDIQDAAFKLAENAIGFISAIAGKNKVLQKAAVIGESAIGIAKMIIANNTANIAALATPQAIATSGASAIPVIAMNNISTGLGVASAIAATAKALSALGGGAAPTAGAGAAGGAGGASAPAAPSFNVVGNSGANQIAGVMDRQGMPPVQAYVVASNVTSAQSLNRNIVSNATLG